MIWRRVSSSSAACTETCQSRPASTPVRRRPQEAQAFRSAGSTAEQEGQRVASARYCRSGVIGPTLRWWAGRAGRGRAAAAGRLGGRARGDRVGDGPAGGPGGRHAEHDAGSPRLPSSAPVREATAQQTTRPPTRRARPRPRRGRGAGPCGGGGRRSRAPPSRAPSAATKIAASTATKRAISAGLNSTGPASTVGSMPRSSAARRCPPYPYGYSDRPEHHAQTAPRSARRRSGAPRPLVDRRRITSGRTRSANASAPGTDHDASQPSDRTASGSDRGDAVPAAGEVPVLGRGRPAAGGPARRAGSRG